MFMLNKLFESESESIGDLCDSGSVHLYGFPGITTH